MHPGALLTSLLSVASAVGVWCWSRYETAGLRRSLSARSGTAAESGQPATTTAEAHAVIQQQAAALEAKVAALDKENRELREKLAAALEAAKPPPDPASVAGRAAAMRELAFTKLPEWVPSTAEDILSRITAARREAVPEDAAARRVRAWRAMGFVPDVFDYREAAASIAGMKAGGWWDAAAGRFHYNKDASLARADSREQFVGALLPVLLAQNFPAAARSWENTDNDDAATAALALFHGDANFTRVRFSISDQLNANFDKGTAPPAPPPVYNAPQFMGETWKWTEDQGNIFVQALHGSGGLAAVNAAWSRLPRSTAEILHPDTLYLANPPFQPQDVPLEAGPVNGTAPFFVNVAGELASYFLLRPWADLDYSTAATEGWCGDRYAVYPGSEQGDHVVWRSAWRTDEDAREFFAALRRILMQRHSIPWQPEFDVTPQRFHVDEADRIIRLVQEGRDVILVDAMAPDFAAALEAKFLPKRQD